MAVYKKGTSSGFEKRVNEKGNVGKVTKVKGAKKPESNRKGNGNANTQVKKHKSQGRGQ